MIKPKNVIIFEGPTVLFSAIGTPTSFVKLIIPPLIVFWK
jgi:hypothetical protein